MRAIDRILILAAMVLFGHAMFDMARDHWARLTEKPRATAPAPTPPASEPDRPAQRRLAPGAALLPPPSSRDPSLDVSPTVARRASQRSVGTAFAVGRDGMWLTARHVIDGCATLQVRRPNGFAPVDVTFIHRSADIAVLRSPGSGPPLPVTEGPLGLGEDGYAFGIAGEGGPSVIHASLLGRAKLMQSGRMTGMTEVTVWAERDWLPPGERWIGGMSGGPLLTAEGAVAGLMSVASQRRGRIFTVAPETISTVMRDTRLGFVPSNAAPVATTPARMEQSRNVLLNRRSVVQLLCTA